MNTPFPYEIIAPKKYFYGREDEIKEIKSHINHSTNILLFSKRRMGKSTLIKNIFQDLEKEYIVIYIDIFNIITAQDFGKLLINSITKIEKKDIKTYMKKLTSLFKRVQIVPTFDADSGNFGIKSKLSNLSFDEIIEDFFTVLFQISKNKNVVLAIDEFQQIANIKDKKIDAILRKYMQESHNISYIFLGSKRNLLNSLFSYKAPLYSMATPISLKSIAKNDIYKYAIKHIDISKKIIDYLYHRSIGETKFIQMILHKIYINKKNIKKITTTTIDDIIKQILISKDDHYKSLFGIFSTNQKKAFKLLAIYKKKLFSNDILQKENISRTSMQSSLNQLFKKEFIDKEDEIYFIPDRTFELWGEQL